MPLNAYVPDMPDEVRLKTRRKITTVIVNRKCQFAKNMKISVSVCQIKKTRIFIGTVSRRSRWNFIYKYATYVAFFNFKTFGKLKRKSMTGIKKF